MKNILVAIAAVVALSTAAVAAERAPFAGQNGDIAQTNRTKDRVSAAVASAKASGGDVKAAARSASGGTNNGTSGPGQQR